MVPWIVTRREYQMLMHARTEARRRGFLVGRRVVLRSDEQRRVGRIIGLNNGSPSGESPIYQPVMVRFPWWSEPIAWSLDALALVD